MINSHLYMQYYFLIFIGIFIYVYLTNSHQYFIFKRIHLKKPLSKPRINKKIVLNGFPRQSYYCMLVVCSCYCMYC